MTWDGKERRGNQDNSNTIFERLGSIDVSVGKIETRLENLHSKVNASNTSVKELLDKHDEILHGNGKPGIASSLNVLKDQFDRHDKADTWFHRTVILACIGIIGFLIKIVFFPI